MNQEHREKISKALLGRKKTEQHRNNIRLGLTGRKLTEDHKRKCAYEWTPEQRLEKSIIMSGRKYPERTNENHWNWKGDNVGYDSLHQWVKSRFPKPDICTNCFKYKPLDLANKGIYNRDLDNWIWLCRSCHSILDNKINNITKSRKVDAKPT